ncbi:MAG: hypothetical protein KDJ97_01650, partial [Anaerolineae bacterium]|nr:hypothetical protein [Anaerolineae bacterium]
MNASTQIPHILLIGPADDPNLRRVLKTQFDFTVSELASGEQFVDVIRQTKLDLIILDVSTSEPSLKSVFSTLAAERLTTPVVLLSVNGDSMITNTSPA